MPSIECDADLDAALPLLSNWGRWGEEDELGTLNLIRGLDPAEGRALISSGESVSLGRPLTTADEGLRDSDHRLEVSDGAARDWLGMTWHGFALTHLDALCHVATPEGRLWNDRPAALVTPQGSAWAGIQTMNGNVSGPCVLLDAAPDGALPAGKALRPAELEQVEQRQGVRVRAGDVLFVRTGRGRRNLRDSRAGLHASCLPWLKERGVALLGSDGDSDAAPADPAFAKWESPIHEVAIPYLGLPLIDGADLDLLALRCGQVGRWRFFVVVSPWRFHGMTSSPVSPVAFF